MEQPNLGITFSKNTKFGESVTILVGVNRDIEARFTKTKSDTSYSAHLPNNPYLASSISMETVGRLVMLSESDPTTALKIINNLCPKSSLGRGAPALNTLMNLTEDYDQPAVVQKYLSLDF